MTVRDARDEDPYGDPAAATPDPLPGGAARAAWRPRVVHEAVPMDLVEAEKAAAQLLTALGQPVHGPHMAETPRRMAHAYAELLTVGAFDLTTFPNTEQYDELGWSTASRCGPSASTTCCRSSASPTSATCPATGSWASRRSPGSWTSSAIAPRPRNG
jgi:hypothetical protein